MKSNETVSGSKELLQSKLLDLDYLSDRTKYGEAQKLAEVRKKSKELLRYFVELNLGSKDYVRKIAEAYDKFEQLGLFQSAKEIREDVYGNNLTTYGVVYKGDTCISSCEFCPAHVPTPGERKAYQPQELESKDVVNEVLATMLQGHTEVCLLQGDVQETVFMRNATQWLPEIVRICGPLGLEKLVLNVQTLSKAGYGQIQQLLDESNTQFGTRVALNVRTFQETYDLGAYAKAIPNPHNSKLGQKWNFARRRMTQETATRAGIEGVGMGMLVGVSPKPFKDLVYLAAHLQQLLKNGINVERVAIPSAHNIEGLNTHVLCDIGYGEAYQQLMEMLYAQFRILADPSVSLVMSERDEPTLLQKLARYADHTTVGVVPTVGGNIQSLLKRQNTTIGKQLKIFKQANVSSLSPTDFIIAMKEAGFTVQLARETQHLQEIKKLLSQRLGKEITVDEFP